MSGRRRGGGRGRGEADAVATAVTISASALTDQGAAAGWVSAAGSGRVGGALAPPRAAGRESAAPASKSLLRISTSVSTAETSVSTAPIRKISFSPG